MSNPYFRFKQFTVWHDRCAMKVGTDGVLIGAWCDVDACRRILDVGCGTGLISLMIAQRTSDRTMIEGVEIDAVAAEQAAENTDRSPWKNRLRIHTSDFLDFATSATVRYDHIVSNPPYFENRFYPKMQLVSRLDIPGVLHMSLSCVGLCRYYFPEDVYRLYFRQDCMIRFLP